MVRRFLTAGVLALAIQVLPASVEAQTRTTCIPNLMPGDELCLTFGGFSWVLQTPSVDFGPPLGTVTPYTFSASDWSLSGAGLSGSSVTGFSIQWYQTFASSATNPQLTASWSFGTPFVGGTLSLGDASVTGPTNAGPPGQQLLGGGQFGFPDFEGAPNAVTLNDFISDPGGTPNQLRVFVQNASDLPCEITAPITYVDGTPVHVQVASLLPLPQTPPPDPCLDLVTDIGVIPEPSTWILLGTGLLAIGGAAWRRREQDEAEAS